MQEWPITTSMIIAAWRSCLQLLHTHKDRKILAWMPAHQPCLQLQGRVHSALCIAAEPARLNPWQQCQQVFAQLLTCCCRQLAHFSYTTLQFAGISGASCCSLPLHEVLNISIQRALAAVLPEAGAIVDLKRYRVPLTLHGTAGVCLVCMAYTTCSV
jgi:hypothetical protein